MEALATFIESEQFFPVLILLLAMLVGVFMWVLVSGKNEEKKRRAKQKSRVDDTVQIKIVQEDVQSVPVEDIFRQAEEIANNNIVENNKILSEIEKTDEVKVEKTNELVEESTIETNDTVENKEVFETITEKIVPSDTNVISESVITSNEVDNVENNVAFNSEPTNDYSINEEIKIDEPNEYIGEKTEIFDFPDFSEALDEKQNEKSVEQDVIDAANKYIESIMKR